jgi:hypothetical protein
MTKYDLSKIPTTQSNPLQLWETISKSILCNSSNNNVVSCTVHEDTKPYLSVYFKGSSKEYTYKTPDSICHLIDDSAASWWSSLPF